MVPGGVGRSFLLILTIRLKLIIEEFGGVLSKRI